MPEIVGIADMLECQLDPNPVRVTAGLQACRAYYGCQQGSAPPRSDLLIPLSIFELIEDSREIEILFEMLNRALALYVGRCSCLASIDIIPPHWTLAN